MNEVQVFDNEEFGSIRAVRDEDGEPMFVAKDVCTALEVKNSRDAIARLDNDEKGVVLIDTPGGEQQMQAVNEAGLYVLVLSSRKPEAKAFQRWVTHEVLPALRRSGGYIAGQESMSGAELAKAGYEWLMGQVAEKDRQIAEMRPKAMFADAVGASDGTCLVGELAKMIRQNGVPMGQNRLFELLRRDGYLGKTGSNRNVPTQRSMEMGLFRIKETSVIHSDGHVTLNRTPKVTGRGQRYFIERYGDPELGIEREG